MIDGGCFLSALCRKWLPILIDHSSGILFQVQVVLGMLVEFARISAVAARERPRTVRKLVSKCLNESCGAASAEARCVASFSIFTKQSFTPRKQDWAKFCLGFLDVRFHFQLHSFDKGLSLWSKDQCSRFLVAVPTG